MVVLELASMHSANLLQELHIMLTSEPAKTTFLALEGHAVQEWNTRK